MWRAQHVKGFTIVELLIVVVVVAILAAITIVAYNGVTQKANESVALSNASQASEKIKLYAVDHGDAYPTDLASAGVVSDDSTTNEFTANASGYCITSTVKGVSYFSAQTFTYTSASTNTIDQPTPAKGVCPGHAGSGVAVTNLKANPNAESSANAYIGPNSSVLVRDTSRSHSGAASIRTTMPINSVGQVGVSFYTVATIDDTTLLKPNSTYTLSAYVYVPTGTVNVFATIQGAGKATRTDQTGYSTSVKNQWVRLANTFTTSASGNIVLYVLNQQATTVAGTQFWVDDVMITEGTTVPPYADGNTAGWVWNGAANESTSTGPLL